MPCHPENPFSQTSALPYQAPPFDKISDEHYRQALESAIEEKRKAVKKIIADPAPADFANTCLALEQSGEYLRRVSHVFSAMLAGNTSDALQALDEDMAPRLAALDDDIRLNATLFARLDEVYQKRHLLGLDDEALRLTEVMWQTFELSGARLDDTDKNALKALNQESASLSSRFTRRLLAATQAGGLAISDIRQLAGLSQSEVAAAAAAADAAASHGLSQQWLLALQNTTQQPALLKLSCRSTRHALFIAGLTRAEKGGDDDTREIIARLAQVRARQAKLLGYSSYAAWKMQDQMAKTPQAALDFMRKIVPASVARAQQEADEIQQIINRTQKTFTLSAWDWQYYAEQVRREQYDLNDDELSPYFELNSVLEKGAFYTATCLFGITFRPRDDLPVYHSDVRVYEVMDKDGSPLALFYTDWFRRNNKGGGAWMGNFVEQSTQCDTCPVIYNVANFTRPADGSPALLAWDEVITLFHEFGHALHGIFANGRYASLSGTATPRDFVEFPSQINEHWASHEQVFNHYARHYQTGEKMPDALRKRMIAAAKFNQGYAMSELLAAAMIDQHWHALNAGAPLQNVEDLEQRTLQQEGLDLPAVPPRYRSSYFQHIWGNGYAAGYYAYLWTQMLADDGYAWFEEHGGLTAENGQRFRDMILSQGNRCDLHQLYHLWLGRASRIDPMLHHRGLKPCPRGKGEDAIAHDIKKR